MTTGIRHRCYVHRGLWFCSVKFLWTQMGCRILLAFLGNSYGLVVVGEVRLKVFGHKNILHHSGSESCKCVSRVIAWVVKIILRPASRVSSISRKYMGLAWRSRWSDDDRKKCMGIAMGYCHLSSLTIWTKVVYQRSLRWLLRIEGKSWRKFERSFRTT